MRLRIRFKKTGRLKYIGHLDLLNIWNRAIKSAGLPVLYSNGFNPHMLISFAAPLPLGITSISEYADIDFDDSVYAEAVPFALNQRFPEGLEAAGVRILNPPYRRIASVVTSAEYRISTSFDIAEEQLDVFLSQQTINILKKTKRHNEVTDISPDILYAAQTAKRELSAVLSCGSAQNLKPTLFMEAFRLFLESDEPAYKTRIERTEIFGLNETGERISINDFL